MILDHISNAANYFSLHPSFEKAFEYVKSLDFEQLVEGTHEIDGIYMKAAIAKINLRNKDAAKLETHRKYIDIQIPIGKPETFGWKPLSQLQHNEGAYDGANDILFFNDEPTAFITVHPGEFIIFSPEDAHAPLIGEGETLKIILKVAVL